MAAEKILLPLDADGGSAHTPWHRGEGSTSTCRGGGSCGLPLALVAGITPHDLRHTAASLAIAAGANEKAVRRMLGHASASMTLEVYAGPFGDDRDAVASRLDDAVAARGADYLRTPWRAVIDLGKRRSPGR